MSGCLRPLTSIMEISPYVGGDVTPIGMTRRIVLASNENPFGAPPEVSLSLSQLGGQIHRYPSGCATDLKDKISVFYQIPAIQILCGNGSEEILHLLARAYVSEPGDEVMLPQYGFGVYKIAALSVGAVPIEFPRVDFQFNVSEILSRVTSKTKIIYIDNPGNPIGTYLTTSQIAELLNALPKSILLVIDSAYAEYLSDIPDYDNAMSFVDQHENLVVTRTFSKIFGMAGLRLGWCYTNHKVIDVLNRIRAPFNVSVAAQYAGIAALSNANWVKKSHQHNRLLSEWFKEKLTELELETIPCWSNFVLVKFSNAHAVYQYLGQRGIIVRPMTSYNLPEYIRISIGLEEEMRELSSLLREIIDLSI